MKFLQINERKLSIQIALIFFGYFLYSGIFLLTPYREFISGFILIISYFFIVNVYFNIKLTIYTIKNLKKNNFNLFHTSIYFIFGCLLLASLGSILNEFIISNTERTFYYYFVHLNINLLFSKIFLIFSFIWILYHKHNKHNLVGHIFETIIVVIIATLFLFDNNLATGNTDYIYMFLNVLVSYYLFNFTYLSAKNELINRSVSDIWYIAPFFLLVFNSVLDVFTILFKLPDNYYLIEIFITCFLHTFLLRILIWNEESNIENSEFVINSVTHRAYTSIKDLSTSLLELALLIFLLDILNFTIIEMIIFGIGFLTILLRHIYLSNEKKDIEYSEFDNVVFVDETSRMKLIKFGINRSSDLFTAKFHDICIFDEERNVIAYNKRLLQHFNAKSINAIYNLFKERDKELFFTNFNLAYSGLKQDFTVRIPLANGEQNVYEILLEPISIKEEVCGVQFSISNYHTRYTQKTSHNSLAYIGSSINETNKAIFIRNIENDIQSGNTNGAMISIKLLHHKDWVNYLPSNIVKKLTSEFLDSVEESILKQNLILHEREGYFLLYLDTDYEDVLNICQTIYDKNNWNKNIGGYKGYHIVNKISIGISFYTDINDTVENWIYKTQMLRSIADDNNNIYLIYNDKYKASLEMKFYIQTNVRNSIINNEFFMVYQPKVDSITNQIVSLEALVRWINPSKGFISPGEFIPIVEETNDIVHLGTYIFKEVVKQQITWKNQGVPIVPIAINIGAKQLYDSEFLKTVLNLFKNSPLEVGDIALEITERDNIANNEDLKKKLHMLRAIGYDLQIDDFGAGNTVLSSLVDLPFSTVKIDRNIISKISEEEFLEIVRSIKQIADKLNLNVVCEGVETKEEVQILRTIGCTLIQGYYYYKPLSTTEIKELLVSQGDIHDAKSTKNIQSNIFKSWK